MTHPWVNWRYLELNGRIRKKAINFPRRERTLVRSALSRLGIRYREACPFINPHYSGANEDMEKVISWFDFVCYKNGLFFVILFHPYTGHGLKAREVRSFESKKKLLETRDVPYVVLKRSETSQVYQMQITMFVRKLKRDNPIE